MTLRTMQSAHFTSDKQKAQEKVPNLTSCAFTGGSTPISRPTNSRSVTIRPIRADQHRRSTPDTANLLRIPRVVASELNMSAVSTASLL